MSAVRIAGAIMLHQLWKFIRNDKNRNILAWLGGGAIAIITGAWALFTYNHSENRPTTASTTTVVVPVDSGIASGRDTVVNAPISIGLNEKQVREAQKPLTDQLEKLAAQVGRDKGVEITSLRAILVRLGENGVRDEDVPTRLNEKATELLTLREEIARLQQGRAELAPLAQQAQVLIDDGDIDAARGVLTRPAPPVPKDRARIINIGNQQLSLSFWNTKSWQVLSVGSGRQVEVLCPECQGTIMVAFHNGKGNDLVKVTSGDTYFLGWSAEKQVWALQRKV
jgi:hypothetical protein